jgi:NADH-quinone oxidoreductase subunit G
MSGTGCAASGWTVRISVRTASCALHRWGEALGAAASAIKGATKLAGLVGDLAPTEAAFSLKQLIEGQGGTVECRTDGAKLPADNRSAYVGTATIEDIDDAQGHHADRDQSARVEAPVLNARIRKAWAKGADVGLIGPAVDLTYEYIHVGTDRAALQKVADRDHSGDGILEKPSVVIVGQGALRETDGEAVLAAAMKLADATGSSLLVLHTAAARVGAMDVGAVTEGGLAAAVDGADVIYNLGADEVDIAAGGQGDLPGVSRGPRCASGRHHPARRRLSRRGGSFRQHRGPPATRVPRELSARRGAGELGDFARAVDGDRGDPAMEHHRPVAQCPDPRPCRIWVP